MTRADFSADDGFRHDVAQWVLNLPVAAAFGLIFTELAAGRALDSSGNTRYRSPRRSTSHAASMHTEYNGSPQRSAASP